MRVFDTLEEAALEIKRDLAKSPLVESSRVQQFTVEAQAREALGYDYTIRRFPMDRAEFIREAVQLGFWKPEEVPAFDEWLRIEQAARLSWQPGALTESLHPALIKTIEGSEPSYTYTDRLAGAVEALVASFKQSPDTRRAFWPIFNREDAVRASRETRVPCSLGYSLIIRVVNGERFLHLTYLERSCDFDRFWLSDLWLARKFQEHILFELRKDVNFRDLKLGHLSHFVISLHTFLDAEVY